jgi:hypothetical protein
MPGHGYISHTHADRGKLPNQHRPCQLPQGANFYSDRRKAIVIMLDHGA